MTAFLFAKVKALINGIIIGMNVRDFVPGYNKIVLPWHFLKATVAGAKYGFPGKKMTVIGITGTNGKTSTSFFVWKMLNHAGYKTGLMTTVAWGGVPGMENKPGDSGSLKSGADGLHQQTKHMTTVDSMTLNRRMKTIFEAGAEFLVLEVTSHAMCQFRTLGIPIEVAAMTNVTHEHLDYHKTFENYRSAKVKLFKKAKGLRPDKEPVPFFSLKPGVCRAASINAADI